MRTTGELKSKAKRAMKGNYSILIMASLATSGLSLVGSFVSTAVFPGTGTVDMILSQVFSFILSLVLSIVSAGLSYMFLNVARGQGCSFADLIYFFKNHPDRVITASFVMALINVAASIPVNYFGFTSQIGKTFDEQVNWLTTYAVLMIVSSVLNLILTLPFAMSYYLLADDTQMSGMEALKESMRMMKGKKIKYFILQLSFVPILFLSIFTLYIALLWVMPYMEMSFAMFYRDLTGELDAHYPEQNEISDTQQTF